MQFEISIPELDEETRYQSLQQVFSIIRTFLSVFRSDDDCRLCIFAAPQMIGSFSLGDALKECIAQERQLHNATAVADIIPLSERPDTFKETTVHLKLGVPVSADDLFRNFRDANARLESAYELELATDMYDADIISFAHTNGQQFGSSEPKSYHPSLTYVTDPKMSIASVIDVGCGAGMFYDLLRRHSLLTGQPMQHYVGIDFSRSQIERARRKYPRAIFQTGDAADLEFPDHTFDIALAWSVLGFLPRDRVNQALAEILRISKRGVMTTLSCTSDDLVFSGPGEAEFNYWGAEYPVFTSQPDLNEILETCEQAGTVDVAVRDTLTLIMPSGLDRRLSEEDETYGFLMEYLRQVLGMLAPEFGGDSAVPRDKVTELMRQGGALQSPDGKAFEIGPGHVWYQYKEVVIFPKGWTPQDEADLAPEYQILQVVSKPN